VHQSYTPPMAEMPDLGSLLQQAQAMQQAMVAQQADAIYTGVAGSGAVRVEVTGTGEFRKVTIHPDVVDPADVELLEDLVLAAVRDAAGQANEAASSAVQQSLGGALGGLLGG
jgi:DNA-binding YbaB/EbfC family protein